MPELKGWLLDVYIDAEKDINLWILGEDGERHHLKHDQPVTFYAAGDHLADLAKYLDRKGTQVVTYLTTRADLFVGSRQVLAIQVLNAAEQKPLFYHLRRRFPDLEWFNAAVHVAWRYAAAYRLFPLAHCAVEIDDQGFVNGLRPLESPYEVFPKEPPLRILGLEPEGDIQRGDPAHLQVYINGEKQKKLRFGRERHNVVQLLKLMERVDPDILLTQSGDGWLFPTYGAIAQQHGLDFNLNRDKARPMEHRRGTSFVVYGVQNYLDERTMLFGRDHVDLLNGAAASQGYHLHGALALARITGMPLEEISRRSPGSGVGAKQVITAMQHEILFPHDLQLAEDYRPATELARADRGGSQLVPIPGIHENVCEADVDAMYPSIIEHFNISAETVGVRSHDHLLAPGTNIPVDQSRPGIIPAAIRDIVNYRRDLKAAKRKLGPNDYRYKQVQARIDGLKWYLVVTGGHLGHAGSWTSLQTAYEAMTAFGRQVLRQGRAVAEERGFTVVTMNIDSWHVKREGATRPEDFHSLIEAMERETGMIINLEEFFPWAAYAPSRQDPDVPVKNRWFGAREEGDPKMRGIEVRRRDTSLYVAEVQTELLRRMGQACSVNELQEKLPEYYAYAREQWLRLRRKQVPVEQLVIRQKLSKALDAYTGYSPAAFAARKIRERTGKELQPGQLVEFILTKDGAHPTMFGDPQPSTIHIDKYAKQLFRALFIVFEALSIDEGTFHDWLFSNAAYYAPPGALAGRGKGRLPLPLWHKPTAPATIDWQKEGLDWLEPAKMKVKR